MVANSMYYKLIFPCHSGVRRDGSGAKRPRALTFEVSTKGNAKLV